MDPGASVGERLDRLDEALTIIRGILAGESMTRTSPHYAVDGARQAPLPVQARIPIAIGASGERKGLRVVARHADIWQQWLGLDEVDVFVHKSAVLDGHLADVGRVPSAVERQVGGRLLLRRDEETARREFEAQVRLHGWGPEMTAFAWAGSADTIAAAITRYRDAGVDGISLSIAAPLDLESLERFTADVRPRFGPA
jgi:alkanesulfonate monooxygenase SsuD/methylene tetrahydromethanopterin reductase-like flavin-dependent oxidoreductase (luciferase family)